MKCPVCGLRSPSRRLLHVPLQYTGVRGLFRPSLKLCMRPTPSLTLARTPIRDGHRAVFRVGYREFHPSGQDPPGAPPGDPAAVLGEDAGSGPHREGDQRQVWTEQGGRDRRHEQALLRDQG